MNWSLEKTDKKSSFRSAYVNTLDAILAEDDKVMVLESDLKNSSGTTPLFEKYPDNCVNFGISEANMISAAGGMSRAGMIPFAHSFAPFITRRVLDQFYLSIAYSNNNLFVYSSDAGIWSQRNGGTHTANEDIAVMSAIPNCFVFDPSDPVQFGWLVRQYHKTKGIYYVRSGRKAEVAHIYAEDSEFEVGKGIVLREGASAVAVISAGMMVQESLEVAEGLRPEGIDVTVVDMFSIKPYDAGLLQKIISENDVVLAVENHSKIGGLGAAVAYEIAKSRFNPVFRHIAIPDAFGEVGSLDYLKEKFALCHSDIKENIIEGLKEAGKK